MEKKEQNERMIENMDYIDHRSYGDKKEYKIERYKWSEAGDRGKLLWLDKKDLKIDLSYQREKISKNKILNIARSFSWKIFGAVSVCVDPDGGYYVTDGAHRVRAALLRRDIEKVPCVLFKSSGSAEEAGMFIDQNTTSNNVSAYDKHRANLKRGCEIAILAEEIVQLNGYKFVKNSPKEYETSIVSTVTSLVKRNAEITKRTFEILASVADGLPVQNQEMKGLFYLISTNQKVDFFDFPIKNLSKVGLGMIQDTIKRTSIFRGKGGEKVFAEAMAELINSGQIKNKVILPS